MVSLKSCNVLLVALLGMFSHSLAEAAPPAGQPIRVGFIGLDSSHCVAFAKLMMREPPQAGFEGLKVTAAYAGGSPDIPSSADRIAGFTAEFKKLGVPIVDSIPELLKQVDAVIINSVDGRTHLAQAREVLKAGKPVFVDKPFAGTLADGLELQRIAKEMGTPCFSSSSLRYYAEVQQLVQNPPAGGIQDAVTYSPCTTEPHHPDLFWYGIHGVEILYTLMGPGCESVTRTHTEATDVVTGKWKDGRIGTFYGFRDSKPGYGALVIGQKGAEFKPLKGSYEPLVVEIVKFFRTGKAPVSLDETVEILAFMQAADASKEQGGKPVLLQEVIKAAGKRAE